MERAEVIRLNKWQHLVLHEQDVLHPMAVAEGPATVVIIKEETAAEATVKCQYHGCTETATERAVGYDENGDDHVYQVCLKHAAEMEPRVFGEKLAEIKTAIEQGTMTLNKARVTSGLEPLDDHAANVLIKKA